jgi:hypothetical protein
VSVASCDRRGSAKSCSPRASFKGSAGGGGGTGVIGSCGAAACGPRGCDPGPAPVVIVITNNSARHPPALERRKYEPAGTRRTAVRSASWPCVSRILELDTGNSDVLQGSVIDLPPGRSDTSDLAFAEDSRPQPGNDQSDRADPWAPTDREIVAIARYRVVSTFAENGYGRNTSDLRASRPARQTRSRRRARSE